jgi:hypothetical protein
MTAVGRNQSLSGLGVGETVALGTLGLAKERVFLPAVTVGTIRRGMGLGSRRARVRSREDAGAIDGFESGETQRTSRALGEVRVREVPSVQGGEVFEVEAACTTAMGESRRICGSLWRREERERDDGSVARPCRIVVVRARAQSIRSLVNLAATTTRV